MALKQYYKEYYSVKKQLAHIFSYISLIIGSLLLFWSFYPYLSFEIYSRIAIQSGVISPIPLTKMISSLQEATSVLGTYNVYSSNLKDFIQADLWFPSKPQTVPPPARINVKEYSLSIPKLNIINAKVTVGGEDLSRSLVQYLPTSLPGEAGNISIFGHSTLPYYASPKDYKGIFTYLPSLEKGDTILVTMNDKAYTYEVYDMFIVDPDNVSVLDQQYDGSYLTAITCVPPGTVQKRLVVKSRLKNLPNT